MEKHARIQGSNTPNSTNFCVPMAHFVPSSESQILLCQERKKEKRSSTPVICCGISTAWQIIKVLALAPSENQNDQMSSTNSLYELLEKRRDFIDRSFHAKTPVVIGANNPPEIVHWKLVVGKATVLEPRRFRWRFIAATYEPGSHSPAELLFSRAKNAG